MANVAFKVSERNTKENKNKLRKSGLVPGVIYGEFLEEPISIKMCNAELCRMLRRNNKGSIISLDLNDKKLNCVVKEVQKNDPKTISHVSFQYVKPNENIKMRIPIKYVGQENLESKRLLLETFNPFIDFQGDVEKIPEYLEVNVSNMDCEDKLFVENINVPKDITVLTDSKTLLAVVNSQLTVVDPKL
ncbi:50S ribosomal protein L25 [Clostridium uliginosum]|uniref:Large subunit ribosomal protein L25 n=1 Tax=Clostridium uliginosum TaxID=119641 RepID=A0A1I1JTQ8_9CLOT|nr:50S ribosomal protein L25 [Clostridium uliginosum]SFC52037.1 large subunit ribosomal protein L25 [Clostridium uliginosum]